MQAKDDIFYDKTYMSGKINFDVELEANLMEEDTHVHCPKENEGNFIEPLLNTNLKRLRSRRGLNSKHLHLTIDSSMQETMRDLNSLEKGFPFLQENSKESTSCPQHGNVGRSHNFH